MIRWATVFLAIGFVAGLLGFGLIAGAAYELAKFVFYLFLGVALLLFIAGWWVLKKAA